MVLSLFFRLLETICRLSVVVLVQYSRSNRTFPINVEPGATSISHQSDYAGIFKSSLAVEQRIPFRFRKLGLQPEHSMNTDGNQLNQPRFNLLRD